MRCAQAFADERPTRCFDQGLEARFLAERRESVARQVYRQRRPRLGQQAMHRPPAIEIGAEAVQEHDRRALASLEPLAIDERIHGGACDDSGDRVRGGGAALDVALLNASMGARASHAAAPNASVARDPPRGGRRAQAERPFGVSGVIGFGVGARSGAQRGSDRRRRMAQGRNKIFPLGHDPADAGANRQHVAFGRRDEFEDARSRRIDLHRRLVGFDLEQRRALDDMRAFGRMPTAHPA